MQNKINQKVPIAKMDELIAAVKGKSTPLYQHIIQVSYDGYPDEQLGWFTIISKQKTIVTNQDMLYILFVNAISVCPENLLLQVSPSAPYTTFGISFSNNECIAVIFYSNSIDSYVLTFVSDTVTEI